MGSLNRVILIGRLGRDAEVKVTPSGATIASFSIAMSETWVDKTTRERQEKTTWMRVALWGKSAEAIGHFLLKGREVCVEGKLDNREWEKDGVKRYSTDVKADRVVLLGSKDSGGGSNTSRVDTTSESDESGAGDAGDDDESLPF
jgi:single-strand DNA-binding protein